MRVIPVALVITALAKDSVWPWPVPNSTADMAQLIIDYRGC
jgi:hypothetical protein